MKDLLNKEMKLSAHILSWCFIAFGLMAMIPGYPIVVGAFFVCLGIYQSFQYGRENNDILYTALLPVKKADVVKAKFAFVCLIEMLSFALMFILTVIRMTVFSGSAVYVNNAMMNANQAFLGYVLVVYAMFNILFVKGFFRTAYKFGKPFISFTIVSFVFAAITEVLHHLPGLIFLNDTDTLGNPVQWVVLAAGIVIYTGVTVISEKKAEMLFEQIDL